MAIQFKEQNTSGKLQAIITIDNGDLEALKTVMEQYSFINEEALLRYALVALLKSSDNNLYIRDNGNIVAMKIHESLIKKENINE